MTRLFVVGRTLPAVRAAAARGPAWAHARQDWIARVLAASQTRSAGGWFALDASRHIHSAPRRFVVAGTPLVVFRDAHDAVVAGPDRCPHMGARLSTGRVEGGAIVCPWHGLRIGAAQRAGWRCVPAHDDGVLTWVRLDDGDGTATARPVVVPRPPVYIDGVVRTEARCEPRDVIANRLDPWHGPSFHPYAFARLDVIELGTAHVVVRVAKRIAGPLALEVDARFECPDRRTIAMTIVAGAGAGSVVETHATPIVAGRTAIVEASLATSDVRGFGVARLLAPLVRPFIERAARRLWADDRVYAERLHELRHE